MKKAFIISIMMIQALALQAQVFCDSSYVLCDSITLDSIIFTHYPGNGDRVHFAITSTHQELYAPTFEICPSNDSLYFVNNRYSYFSLFGPASIQPYYEFLNFNEVGDSLIGHIMVDNSNNQFPNCRIPFAVSVQGQGTGLAQEGTQYAVEIFPNPFIARTTLRIMPALNDASLKLINNMGQVMVEMNALSGNLIVLSRGDLPEGVYFIRVMEGSKVVVISRIVIQG